VLFTNPACGLFNQAKLLKCRVKVKQKLRYEKKIVVMMKLVLEQTTEP
jgi:hypothetical protein